MTWRPLIRVHSGEKELLFKWTGNTRSFGFTEWKRRSAMGGVVSYLINPAGHRHEIYLHSRLNSLRPRDIAGRAPVCDTAG